MTAPRATHVVLDLSDGTKIVADGPSAERILMLAFPPTSVTWEYDERRTNVTARITTDEERN